MRNSKKFTNCVISVRSPPFFKPTTSENHGPVRTSATSIYPGFGSYISRFLPIYAHQTASISPARRHL